jgi:hypothetical protein
VRGLTSSRITSPGSDPITAALVLSQRKPTPSTNASMHIEIQLRSMTPICWGMMLRNRIPTLRCNVIGSTDPSRLTQRYVPEQNPQQHRCENQKTCSATIFRKICMLSQGKQNAITYWQPVYCCCCISSYEAP